MVVAQLLLVSDSRQRYCGTVGQRFALTSSGLGVVTGHALRTPDELTFTINLLIDIQSENELASCSPETAPS